MARRLLLTLSLAAFCLHAKDTKEDGFALLAWDAATKAPAQIIQPVHALDKERVVIGHQIRVESLVTVDGHTHAPVAYSGDILYHVVHRTEDDGLRPGYYLARAALFTLKPKAMAEIYIGTDRPVSLAAVRGLCLLGTGSEVGFVDFHDEFPAYSQLNQLPPQPEDSQAVDRILINLPWAVAIDQDSGMSYAYHIRAGAAPEFEFALHLPRLNGHKVELVDAVLDDLRLGLIWRAEADTTKRNEVQVIYLNRRNPVEGQPNLFRPRGYLRAGETRRHSYDQQLVGSWFTDWHGVQLLRDMVFVSSGERGIIKFEARPDKGLVATKGFPWAEHTAYDMSQSNGWFVVLLRHQGQRDDRCWVNFCHNNLGGIWTNTSQMFEFPAVRLID